MIESADIFRRSFSRVLLARRPAAKDQSTRLVVFRVKLRGIYSPQMYTDEYAISKLRFALTAERPIFRSAVLNSSAI
jgi:hypothetical protein